MKSEYINLTLPDNTSGWKQGWFYLDKPVPVWKERTGQIPALAQSGPTSWRRETPRSSSPCWTTWSSSRKKG
jgi:hypothetical protein